MRLAIVIGHTKEAPGADSAAPLRLTEYDFNTEVAQIMYREAMEKGLKTKIFTRDGIGIKGVYKQVNEWAASSIYDKTVCIELHFNSCDEKNKGRVRGSETLHDLEPLESKDLARELQDAMIIVFNRSGKTDRGIKLVKEGENGHYNLKECKIPSCIVEPAFADNKDEAQMLMELQNEYATALVAAVFNYFENARKLN